MLSDGAICIASVPSTAKISLFVWVGIVTTPLKHGFSAKQHLGETKLDSRPMTAVK